MKENMLYMQLQFNTLLYNLCVYNIFCKVSDFSG